MRGDVSFVIPCGWWSLLFEGWIVSLLAGNAGSWYMTLHMRRMAVKWSSVSFVGYDNRSGFLKHYSFSISHIEDSIETSILHREWTLDSSDVCACWVSFQPVELLPMITNEIHGKIPMDNILSRLSDISVLRMWLVAYLSAWSQQYVGFWFERQPRGPNISALGTKSS